MKKTFKNAKGITLVALVITIIILLILAGITISSLTNTGLFGRAKEAKEKTQVAEENQAKTLNEYEDELNKYLGQKLADKVKVGDYVTYTPDALDSNAVATLKSNLNTYSGKSDSTINAAIDRQDLKWRVLDVQNGQVRLISEIPTTSKIELYGYNGYNNAVKLIDDACKILYNNSKLASKVQNVKVEDIINKLKVKPQKDTIVYTPKTSKYPNIVEKEMNQTILKDNITITGEELGQSEQVEYISGDGEAQSLKLENSYWDSSIDDTKFENSKYYELFINDGKSNYSAYFLSTRTLFVTDENASFGIRYIEGGYYTKAVMWADGWEDDRMYAFRPCITLNSSVQVTSGNGSSESPFEIK